MAEIWTAVTKYFSAEKEEPTEDVAAVAMPNDLSGAEAVYSQRRDRSNGRDSSERYGQGTC